MPLLRCSVLEAPGRGHVGDVTIVEMLPYGSYGSLQLVHERVVLRHLLKQNHNGLIPNIRNKYIKTYSSNNLPLA